MHYYDLPAEEEDSRSAWKQELLFRAKWVCRDGLGHLAHLLHPRRLLPLIILAACVSVPIYIWHQHAQLAVRAASGEPEAQYLMGRRFFDHANSRYDYAAGVRWFGLAATQHYAKAETALGLAYVGGLGVRINYTEAVKWLQHGAEQGESLAQNQLGLLYAQGKGTPQNLDQAMIWFKKAADQGFEPARRNWAFAAASRRHFLAQVTTRSGKTYRGATLQKIDREGITLQFAPETGGVGMAKLKFNDLPDELQQLLKNDEAKPDSRLCPSTQLLTAAAQPL